MLGKLKERRGYTLLETITAMAVSVVLMTGMTFILMPVMRNHALHTQLDQAKLLADGLEEALKNELDFAWDLTVSEEGQKLTYRNRYGGEEIDGTGPRPVVPGYSYDPKSYLDYQTTLTFTWEEPVCTVSIQILDQDGEELYTAQRPIRVHTVRP